MNTEYDPIISQERTHELLLQAYEHAEKAYSAKEEDIQKTFLAHLIGSLGTLVTLLDPKEDGIEKRTFAVQEDSMGKKIGKFFVGGK